MRRYSWKNIWT